VIPVAVLIPARNEAECLPRLLDRLSAAEVERTIVVDNGSTDSTAEIAAGRGATVVHVAEPGYGRSCLAGRADQVVGERRSGPGVPGVRAHARLGNAFITTLLRRVYGSRVRDMGPFRAIRISCLQGLDLDDPDYGWFVQMQVRALRAGCRVRGVPVAFRARTAGVSKVSGSMSGSVRAGVKILKTLAYEILRSPGRAHHPS
jgi:glycosyltransferase involved in cell wall biosynthesis